MEQEGPAADAHPKCGRKISLEELQENFPIEEKIAFWEGISLQIQSGHTTILKRSVIGADASQILSASVANQRLDKTLEFTNETLLGNNILTNISCIEMHNTCDITSSPKKCSDENRSAAPSTLTKLATPCRHFDTDLPVLDESSESQNLLAATTNTEPDPEVLPTSMRCEQSERKRARSGGIGILIQKVAGRMITKAIAEKSPVEGKIHPGDIILEIDGQNANSLQLVDALEMLRGPIGSSVSLKFQSADGFVRQLNVVRTDSVRVRTAKPCLSVCKVAMIKDQSPQKDEYAPTVCSLQNGTSDAGVEVAKTSECTESEQLRSVNDLYDFLVQHLELLDDSKISTNTNSQFESSRFENSNVVSLTSRTINPGELSQPHDTHISEPFYGGARNIQEHSNENFSVASHATLTALEKIVVDFEEEEGLFQQCVNPTTLEDELPLTTTDRCTSPIIVAPNACIEVQNEDLAVESDSAPYTPHRRTGRLNLKQSYKNSKHEGKFYRHGCTKVKRASSRFDSRKAASLTCNTQAQNEITCSLLANKNEAPSSSIRNENRLARYRNLFGLSAKPPKLAIDIADKIQTRDGERTGEKEILLPSESLSMPYINRQRFSQQELEHMTRKPRVQRSTEGKVADHFADKSLLCSMGKEKRSFASLLEQGSSHNLDLSELGYQDILKVRLRM